MIGETSPLTAFDRLYELALGALDGIFRHVTDSGSLPDLPRAEWLVTYPRPCHRLRIRQKQRRAERFEILVRTFLLAAPLLSVQPDLEVRGIRVADYYVRQFRILLLDPSLPLKDRAGSYPELLRLGGDPNATFQQTVEVGMLSAALLLCPGAVWDRLSSAERDALASFLSGYAHGNTCPQNWRIFNMTALAFLHAHGYGADRDRMRSLALGVLNDLQGNGWYRDGEHFDYYNAWTYHTLLPLWCLRYGDREMPDLAARFRRASVEFHRTYSAFFDHEGRMLLWGRSCLYRCAAAAPFFALAADLDSPATAEAAAAGVLPSLPRMRQIVLGAAEQFFAREDCFSDGVLTPGFYGTFSPMLQSYSCRGSAYWAAMIFFPLLLPRAHPFWQVQSSAPVPAPCRGIVLDGPGLCVDRTGGAVLLRTGKVRLRPEDRTGMFCYGKLTYHSSLPWDASPAAMSWVHLSGTGEYPPNLILWGGVRDGVLYRRAYFSYSEQRERQWMNSVLLADLAMPEGLLRFDRPAPAYAGTCLALGSFALPCGAEEVHCEIRRRDDATAVILSGQDGFDAPVQMAMTVWAPLAPPSLVRSQGTNPAAAGSCFLKTVFAPEGEDRPLLLSQVLVRAGGTPFDDDALFPVQTVDPLGGDGADAYRVTLRDGTERLVDLTLAKGGRI